MGARERYALPMTLMEKAVAEQISSGGPPLHLPDLYIEGFRGIDALTIPRLGRVTLLAGENGIGKTTVLEAVGAFATVGEPILLAQMLQQYQEYEMKFNPYDPQAVMWGPRWASIFNGREASDGTRISIGTLNAARLVIELTTLSDDEMPGVDSILPAKINGTEALKITYGGIQYIFPLFQAQDESGKFFFVPTGLSKIVAPKRKCGFVRAGWAISNQEIFRVWDQAVDNNEEQGITAAMESVLNHGMQDIILTAVDGTPTGRIAKVKISSHKERVPLYSLGGGAIRLFLTVLALTNSKDGFLLIDEAENGLHHSIHSDFWRLVFRQAALHNVQVLATTHSEDCIRGFAEAANENPEISSAYYRMERDTEGLYAVPYPADDLLVATLNRTETR